MTMDVPSEDPQYLFELQKQLNYVQKKLIVQELQCLNIPFSAFNKPPVLIVSWTQRTWNFHEKISPQTHDFFADFFIVF